MFARTEKEVSGLEGSLKENWRSLLLAKQHGSQQVVGVVVLSTKSRGWRGSGGMIRLN
jgi:hypothetical protein